MSSCFYRANSCSGLVNKFDSALRGIDKLWLLDGDNDYIKSVFIGRLCGYFREHGEDCEYVFSPFDPKKYDAVILPARGIAVVNGDCIDDTEKYVCKHISLDNCEICDDIAEICAEAKKNIAGQYSCVYALYDNAKSIHDEWENIYVSNMNINRLNNFCDCTADKILANAIFRDRDAVCREGFFGAATAGGYVEHIDSLTDGLKRYFIKGRPGTGKSTFIKRLSRRALELGYDTELFCCGFDVFSADMVVIRDLSVCVFDSTAPHERFPDRDDDEILDFYIHAGLGGIDEEFADRLADITARYKRLISEASHYMAEADKIISKTDEKCAAHIDYTSLNNLVYDTLHELY